MASSSERRKGFWDEDESDQTSISINHSQSKPKESESEVLAKKIHEANVLIDQTHQLYLQYLNGVERRAPVEKAQLLEKMAGDLQRMSPQVTSNRFKLNQFLQHYQTMKDLWVRKLKEKERT